MANKPTTRATERADNVLLAHADARPVHVHAPEGDRFFLPMANAILGCQIADHLLPQIRAVAEKEQRLFQLVATWSSNHEVVERVILGMKSPTEGSVLLVMTSGSHHQSQLEDPATELDLVLHRDFAEFRVDIATVPALGVSDISMFMDPATARELYVRPAGAQA